MIQITKFLFIVAISAILATPVAAQELTGTLKKIRDTGAINDDITADLKAALSEFKSSYR